MLKLYSLVKDRLILFSLGSISGILSGLCAANVILLIKKGLDSASSINHSFLISLILFCLLAALFGVLSSYFVAKMTSIIVQRLTRSLSEKILHARFEYVESISQNIVPVITRGVRTISRFINDIPQVIISVSTIVITMIKMFFVNFHLSLIFFGVFAIQVTLLALAIPYLRKTASEGEERGIALFRNLSDLVFGIKELSLNKKRRDKYISNVIKPNLVSINKAQLKRGVVLSISTRLGELIVFIFTGVLMYLSVEKINIPFEEFKSFLPIVLFLTPLIAKTGGFFKKVRSTKIALSRIRRMGVRIDKREIDSHEKLNIKSKNANEIIRFKNVEFEYIKSNEEEESIKFGPLSLKIKQNKITFIVGGNGSGKTTFSKILTGLYTPKKGTIYFQETQKITKANLSSYRNLYSAYYTDSHLFKQLDHISNNRLANKGNDLISLLEMNKKVKIVNKRFNTIKLSFGQRCRLALISNILDNKEIYIFDEWAANQDPYFKEVFYYKILPFLKEEGKTVIVISHDEKYFDVGDEIIELKEGMKN